MSNKGNFYVTTAIAYTSGKPHIGNTYEVVLTDAIARYKRQEGYDVFYMTGTDEHGLKIEQKAEAEGIKPKEYVDKKAGEVKAIWDLMNTSYNKFMRTTDSDHEKQVQKIFKKLFDQGDIYKSTYEGMYCTACESFWTKSQLNEDKCPDCGREVNPAKEEAYFFKMSKYADRLMKYYDEHPEFIQPVSRKNEMINNFLKPGLQDLCVSRTSFTWGIPVDFDPKHVVYVWLDALTNYITGIGYDVDGNYGENYKKFWPADLHVVGKDIIRFHTIYWPIFLMALNVPLPKKVFGHPWLIQSDGKMSKSRGNVIYADDLVDIFGVDAVRYFLIHEMPYENDGVLSWELLVERINSDLANTVGNLVKRTVAMTNKYFDGVVENTNVIEEVDLEFKEFVTNTKKKVEEKMDSLHVADALTEVIDLFKRCNKYIDETEPWILAKDEAKKDRLKSVLYNLTEGINVGATLLKSFLPDTSESILKEINGEEIPYDELDSFGHYKSKNKVTEEPKTLFERLNLEDILKKSNELQEKAKELLKNSADSAYKKENRKPLKHKDSIEYDDFSKLELRTGKVISCEAVPKSKKLLCFKIEAGNEVKQIISGIHKYYEPKDLVGKTVVYVSNLKPVKLAGLDSEGMILSAEDDEGNLSVITTEREVNSGAEVL